MKLRIAVAVGLLVVASVNRAGADPADPQRVESFLRYERVDQDLPTDLRTLFSKVEYAPQRVDLTIGADGVSLVRFTRMEASMDGDRLVWKPLPEEAAQFNLTEGEMSALRFAAGDLKQWRSATSGPRSTPGVTVAIPVDGDLRATNAPPPSLERLLERLIDQCVFVKDLARGRSYSSAAWAVAMAFRPADLRNPLLSYLKSNPPDDQFTDALRGLREVVSPVEYSGLIAAELRGPRARKVIEMAVTAVIQEPPTLHSSDVTTVLYQALEEIAPRWANAPEVERAPYRGVIGLIGHNHNREQIPLLIKLLAAEPQDGWGEITQALAQLGASATPGLIPMLDSKDIKQRRSAVAVLERMVDFDAVDPRTHEEETRIFRDRGLARLRQIATTDWDAALRKKARAVLPKLEAKLLDPESRPARGR